MTLDMRASSRLVLPFWFRVSQKLNHLKVFGVFVLDDSSRPKFGTVWGACRLLENWVIQSTFVESPFFFRSFQIDSGGVYGVSATYGGSIEADGRVVNVAPNFFNKFRRYNSGEQSVHKTQQPEFAP